MPDYQILELPSTAREYEEPLGSKLKFWLWLDGQRWLFKQARLNTGEDWAEKVAAEVAAALAVPAAQVELAQFVGLRGCVSRNFVDAACGQSLVHGNEVLALQVTNYDRTKTFGQSDHTLDNIIATVRAVFSPEEALSDRALTQLASYMVLDALIGNTDRHHENWGLLVSVSMVGSPVTALAVAPSFDHASSLGRELLDVRRADILQNNRLRQYLLGGRGGIFRHATAAHGESPLRLVQVAARAYPDFFEPALSSVAALDPAVITDIVHAVPLTLASATAQQFACEMMLMARTTLMDYRS